MSLMSLVHGHNRCSPPPLLTLFVIVSQSVSSMAMSAAVDDIDGLPVAVGATSRGGLAGPRSVVRRVVGGPPASSRFRAADEPLTCYEAWLRCRSDVTCRVLIDVFVQACDESGTYVGDQSIHAGFFSLFFLVWGGGEECSVKSERNA